MRGEICSLSDCICSKSLTSIGSVVHRVPLDTNPRLLKSVAIAAYQLPEIEKRTLSLKLSHTWFIYYVVMNVQFIWKFHPYQIGFIVVEDVTHATGKNNVYQFSSCVNMCSK